MLTPQEIQDTKFEKAVFGGYDMAQIDKFLDELLVDYNLLYKENAALKGKMRVLVDKIDEYRAVDEEMRKALYTAQLTAKEITEKAEKEAQKIIANAEAEAKNRVRFIDDEIYANTLRLKEMRDICAKYAQTVRGLMEKAAADISLTENKEIDDILKSSLAASSRGNKADTFEIELPQEVTIDTQPAAEEKMPVDEPTIEIDISPEVADQETASEDEKNEDSKLFDINVIREVVEEDEEPDEDDFFDDDEDDEEEKKTLQRPRFNFVDLKFGKNYKNQD